MNAATNLTRLLHDVDEGRVGAMDELMETVYDDLRRIAERHLSARYGRDLAGISLEPEALVNESFLRLIKQRKRYDNRGQFFAIATKVMIRVLVDYQRHRGAQKRGGDRKRMTLCLDRHGVLAPPDDGNEIDIDILVHSLVELERLDSRKADVVKMRVIWGLEMKEIATSLSISLATVERDWAFAKAWLARDADRGIDDLASEGAAAAVE